MLRSSLRRDAFLLGKRTFVANQALALHSLASHHGLPSANVSRPVSVEDLWEASGSRHVGVAIEPVLSGWGRRGCARPHPGLLYGPVSRRSRDRHGRRRAGRVRSASSASRRSVETAVVWCRPPSAWSEATASAVSSIVASPNASSHRCSHRAVTRPRLPGSFIAISAVSSRRSRSVGRGISTLSVASATVRLPRSIARSKIERGCPWAVTATPSRAGRRHRP